MQTTIPSCLRIRMGSPLRVIMDSSTDTRPVRQPFRSLTIGWRLSAPASWAELLAACFRATGQGLLRRCSGRALVTWRLGDCETTGPVVRGRVRRPSGVCRPRLSCMSSCGFTSLSNSSSLNAYRGRPGRLLKCLFRVCGERPRRNSARQPREPSKEFFQSFHDLCKVDVVGF